MGYVDSTPEEVAAARAAWLAAATPALTEARDVLATREPTLSLARGERTVTGWVREAFLLPLVLTTDAELLPAWATLGPLSIVRRAPLTPPARTWSALEPVFVATPPRYGEYPVPVFGVLEDGRPVVYPHAIRDAPEPARPLEEWLRAALAG